MPAPSPVFFSQPDAPRCSRLKSTCNPLSTIECERLPAMSTTKPRPQASCSCRGSYNPCLCGKAVCTIKHIGSGANVFTQAKGHQLCFADGLSKESDSATGHSRAVLRNDD